eukprot:gene16353-21255_t
MLLRTAAAFVATLATLRLSRAVSNGHTYECNPSGNFGCASWEMGHRMKCVEDGPDGAAGKRGPMHTDKYTLRAGKDDPAGDSTHYVPGTMVNLWVTTTDYDWKYKGFFARAVDAKGRVVGQWEFPGIDHQ